MDYSVILSFWPLILLQFLLMVVALVDLRKRKTFRHLSKGFWILIIILLNLIGPILYFVIGRGEE